MASVLIVDDDQDTRELLGRFLESIGHNVRLVANGRDAVQAAIEELPDVIVSDLMMPQMSGAGLLETLRGYVRLHRVPVIIWTGAEDSLILERARALNVRAVLTKPRATLEDLRRAIESIRGRPEDSAEGVSQRTFFVPGRIADASGPGQFNNSLPS
jgi:CheY-like chemotaxis protein